MPQTGSFTRWGVGAALAGAWEWPPQHPPVAAGAGVRARVGGAPPQQAATGSEAGAAAAGDTGGGLLQQAAPGAVAAWGSCS